MENKNKMINSINMLFLALPLMLLVSCGYDNGSLTMNNKKFYAPDKSTLVVTPDTVTVHSSEPTTQDFTVTAKYEDGTPIPFVNIHISGTFAAPFSPAQYQFYYYPDGSSRVGGNRAVDSGFEGQTDQSGVYSFSIVIIGGASVEDKIFFTSGTANTMASLTSSATTT